MAAIDESLWIGYDDNDALEKWIGRYNIAEGEYNPSVYEWGSFDANATHGAIWDGAYHLWLHHNHSVSKFKRINLFDESVDDWPCDVDSWIGPKGLMSDYRLGIIWQGGVDSPMGFGGYSYGTKQTFVIPENLGTSMAYSGGMASIPPWATNDPGTFYTLQSNSSTAFWRYSWLTGWTSRTVAPFIGNTGPLVWADGSGTEYIYYLFGGSTDDFRKYNVSTNTWSIVGDPPGPAPSDHAVNCMSWDGDNYIYFHNWTDETIYKFDCTAETWSEYLALPDTAHGNCFVTYTPRIRFVYLDQSGERLDSPMSLGSVPKDRVSAGVKYYIRALEAEAGTVTIQIISDNRGDADDILQIAPDSSGAPGTWGSSAAVGTFVENQERPFWLRCNPGAGTTQESKIARLKLSIS